MIVNKENLEHGINGKTLTKKGWKKLNPKKRLCNI